jgi:hypothetical protein
VRNPACVVYCKKTWPGGLVCLPKGSAAPDPGVYGRAAPGGGGIGGNAGKCYGENMAAAADIASTGSYFGDLGARSAAAALTERARQDIATADRREAAGVITEEAHAIAVASAIARAPVASMTAVAPSAAGAYAPSSRTTGYDGRVIGRGELEGVCGAPGPGKVFCKTEWPGGFVSRPAGDPAPSGPWVPATEEVAAVDLVNPRTGIKTRVLVSRLVPGPDCYPNGKPWWIRGGAWATRATIGVAEATPATIAHVGRSVAEGVRAVIRAGGLAIDQTAAPQTFGKPTPSGTVLWCKTMWPGGTVERPAGAPRPSNDWAPADSGACYRP